MHTTSATRTLHRGFSSFLATSSAFSEISKPRSIVPEPGKRRPTSRDSLSSPGTTSRSRPLFRPSWVVPSETRDAARRVLEATADNYGRLVAGEALGHLALVLAAPEEAVAQLEPSLVFVRREAIAEPGACRFTIDLIEALVELGRRDDAIEILDWYEGNARRLERASALANCLRCRGLLAAQAGDLEAALAALRGGALVARPGRDPARSRPDAARARCCAASREATTGGARDAGESPRPLRRDRRRALGRAGSRRASPNQRARADDGRAHPRRGTRRGPRRRGKDESRGRGRALPLRSDGRRAPLAHLRKARCPTPHRAGSSPRVPSITGDRGVKHGGLARFSRADRSLASRQVARKAT